MNEFYFYTEEFTVGYNGVPLIKNIEINLKKGEILTLIGPNGAGKTTILKSIIRQLEPIGGLVFLEGSKMKNLSGNELAKKLSVVLTERVKPEMMTCEDVVATGRYPYTGKFGILSEEDRCIVRESMELVHISEFADRDFSRISDGQKQRVMLARAICQQPDIIVLDEPTSFLDIKYKIEFMSIIQNMARTRNLSVIMSLHELDLAERVSDKLVCVKGDRIDRFGTPEEIFQKGYIAGLYDMTSGTFDEQTGNIELEAVSGEPQIFVIAGCGTGTELFRHMQREGVPFATGIIYKNDTDYAAAAGLAAKIVTAEPFSPVAESSIESACKLIDGCHTVFCSVDTDAIGEYGEPLRRLKEYARKCGKLKNTR